VFGIPGAIRHYLAGRQFSVADEYGIPYGTVRVNYQHLDRARWSKSMTAFGSSASCTTISDISTGAQNLATPRQPVRPKVVTHVLGTICHPSLRAGQMQAGAPRSMKMGTIASPWHYDGAVRRAL
jgi:hypothetical protein